MKYEDIKEKEQEYQERMDELRPEGTHMGSVLFPSEESSEAALRAFDELMTEHGWLGIEYAQESLHSMGGRWMDVNLDDPYEESLEDFERYKENT